MAIPANPTQTSLTAKTANCMATGQPMCSLVLSGSRDLQKRQAQRDVSAGLVSSMLG
jgi:hypothetical protein